jgi:electron transport complex protein RnfG
MKDIFTMTIALILFAAVACAGLAVVYEKTKEPIKVNQTAALTAAQKKLFPNADSFEVLTGGLKSSEPAVSFGDVYIAKQGNTVLGLEVNSKSAGFQDNITALVGVGADGAIAGVEILLISDTPGLGANASSPTYFVDKPNKITFYGQFTGKRVTDNIKVKKDGGVIDAITAATITSRAVSGIVRNAAQAAAAWLSANGGSK